MDKGRYAGDTVLDYLQNKDTKALVFTDKHLVYLNLKRQRLRWAFPVAQLSNFTTHGQALIYCPTVLRLNMAPGCNYHFCPLFHLFQPHSLLGHSSLPRGSLS